MVGGQVLDQGKGHATLGVGGHVAKDRLKRGQSSGRGADADDRKASLSHLRHRRPLLFSGRRVRCLVFDLRRLAFDHRCSPSPCPLARPAASGCQPSRKGGVSSGSSLVSIPAVAREWPRSHHSASPVIGRCAVSCAPHQPPSVTWCFSGTGEFRVRSALFTASESGKYWCTSSSNITAPSVLAHEIVHSHTRTRSYETGGAICQAPPAMRTRCG